MEGVKRIKVFLNDDYICTIRAPKHFKDLHGRIESKINLKLFIHSYKVSTANIDFGRIFDQTTYEQWLLKAGFSSLNLQIENRALAIAIKNFKKKQKKKRKYKYIDVPEPSYEDQFNYEPDFSQFYSAPKFSISPSNTLACILDSEKLLIYNIDPLQSTEIVNEKFQKSSRLLILHEKILITGGCRYPAQALSIDSSDFAVKSLSDLNTPRFWHAMANIEGFPAVIGGCGLISSEKIHLKSVEILKQGYWEPLPDLHFARSSPSVTEYGKNTYVFGGLECVGDQNFPISSIEIWKGLHWEVASVIMPLALQSVGGCCDEEKIVLFGGKDFKNQVIDKVFEVRFQNGITNVKKKLDEPTKFTHGISIVKDCKVFALDWNGKCISLDF